jgi:hypothetical protein
MGHLRVALSFQMGAGCGPVARPHFYRAWENTMATKTRAVVDGPILIATETFAWTFGGAEHVFQAGVTRVRSGHPILEGIEHLFKPVDAHYDIEQATAAPGERRGA